MCSWGVAGSGAQWQPTPGWDFSWEKVELNHLSQLDIKVGCDNGL